MDWVTRKSFHKLSTRQQHHRIRMRRLYYSQQQNNHSKNETSSSISIPSNQTNTFNSQDNLYSNRETENLCEHRILKSTTQYEVENAPDLSSTNTNNCTNDTCNVSNSFPQFENENVDNIDNFKNLFRQCCISMNISHAQTNALLRILRTHKCFRNLPKNSRTLLSTGKIEINLLPIDSGVYWHVGFLKSLKKHLLLYNDIPSVLHIELSTDGFRLSPNNHMQFWPIQYRVINIKNFKPLILGIYKGLQKPSDPFLFFQSFLDEVKEVNKYGGIFILGRLVPLQFTGFVGDAPARSLVLNHYRHNSTNPCSKCKVNGFRYENRVMVYLGVDHEKRTDEDYERRYDEDHFKPGKSPLSELSIPLVSRVPFEVMHLVYLGVMVRLLDAWFPRKYGIAAKLDGSCLQELCLRYSELNKSCPNEFARRPTTLSKYSTFKATELRHLLLYAAPIISFGILKREYYFHLLLLNVAMRILTSATSSEKNMQVAEKALKTFVKYSQELYTPAFVSYNVHGLLHLVDDAKEVGPLEQCSAFVYENNMPLLRKYIRNHPKPLQQFANRLNEKNGIQHLPVKLKGESVLNKHVDGPIPETMNNCEQYKKYKSDYVNFTLDNCNNFCKLHDDSICKIENIIVANNNIFFVVRKFLEVGNFYDLPLKSKCVGVYKCKQLSHDLRLIRTCDVSAKCYSMPSWTEEYLCTKNSIKINDELILSTLLHCN